MFIPTKICIYIHVYVSIPEISYSSNMCLKYKYHTSLTNQFKRKTIFCVIFYSYNDIVIQ